MEIKKGKSDLRDFPESFLLIKPVVFQVSMNGQQRLVNSNATFQAATTKPFTKAKYFDVIYIR
jgi:hypothetical protein